MDNLSTRTVYLNKETIDNISQYDLGSFPMDHYNFGKINYIILSEQDLCRPDLISYRAYNTSNYWWFLMWFNGISDIWNDLRENMVLKYPDFNRMLTFLKERAEKVKDNRNSK